LGESLEYFGKSCVNILNTTVQVEDSNLGYNPTYTNNDNSSITNINNWWELFVNYTLNYAHDSVIPPGDPSLNYGTDFTYPETYLH